MLEILLEYMTFMGAVAGITLATMFAMLFLLWPINDDQKQAPAFLLWRGLKWLYGKLKP